MIVRLRRNRPLKLALLLILAAILVRQSLHAIGSADPHSDDFIQYWAAGRLVLIGGNPYLPADEQLLSVPEAVDWLRVERVITYLPPWALSSFVPIGFVSFSTARFIWLLVSLGLILVCGDCLWHLYGGPARYKWLAPCLCATFFPAVSAWRNGQIGPLILAGVVAFLYFQKRQRWGWAAVAALVMAFKPHPIYLVWIALCIWIFRYRLWRLSLMIAAAVAIATAITLAFNPYVIGQYANALARVSPFYWGTPTLGSILRLAFGWEYSWLPFIAPALGIIWLGLYQGRRKGIWQWLEEMPLLLLVSVTTSWYGWPVDQVVLLPAVMQVAVWSTTSPRRAAAIVSLVVYLVINGVLLVMNQLAVNQFHFYWLAPALLVGYVSARRGFRREEEVAALSRAERASEPAGQYGR
ncbi:MAG: DUF2029 domain-containing protein [Anaerolineae bacterium]|nr:DUF2029 domain-containing protein [Anaerolineae bacterium]